MTRIGSITNNSPGSRAKRGRGLVAIVALLTLCAGTMVFVRAQSPAAADGAAKADGAPAAFLGHYHYYSGGRAVELTVADNRIAVFHPRTRMATAGTDGKVASVLRPGHPQMQTLAGTPDAKAVLDEVERQAAGDNTQFATPVLRSASGEQVIPTGEVVVKFKPGTSAGRVQALLAAHGFKVSNPPHAKGTRANRFVVRAEGARLAEVFDRANALATQAEVEYSYPDVVSLDLHLASRLVPNDHDFSHQWQLDQNQGDPAYADINAPEAWGLLQDRGISMGDNSGMIVAVLDTGTDMNQEDLNLWTDGNGKHGYDFWDDDDDPSADPNDLYPHGTMCAGLIGARGNNGLGVAGVYWGAQIMTLRISSDGYYWGLFVPYSEIADALDYAVENHAQVVNCSFGANYPENDATYPDFTDVAREACRGRDGKGVVLVGAAGNESGQFPLCYPARLPYFIAVGATDKNDTKFDYSNPGHELDVVAPSGKQVNIYPTPPPDKSTIDTSTWTQLWTTDMSPGGISDDPFIPLAPSDNEKYTAWFAGTSGATAEVSGVAALLLRNDPSLTASQVQAYLRFSAKDITWGGNAATGRDNDTGYGRTDAHAALVQSTTLPVVTLRQPRQFTESHGAPAMVSDTAHYFTQAGDFGSEFGITTVTQHVAQSTDFIDLCGGATNPAYLRVLSSGELEIAGEVVENTYSNADLSNAVVIVRGSNGQTLSFIDQSGNLKVTHSNYIAENPDMSTRKFQ